MTINLPGFVPASKWSPVYMRVLSYGPPKAGKSTFCGTWPDPLFLHPVVESGYDTFRLPDGTNHFPHVELGATHHLWLQEERGKEQHSCISSDLRAWLHHLSIELEKKTCPYQTIVIGGFSVLQSLVVAEGEKIHRRSGNQYASWGYVLNWSNELLQTLCSLPAHVILECSADHVGKDGGSNAGAMPSIQGKSYQNILANVNVILWHSRLGNNYLTSISSGTSQVNGVRFSFLNTQQPIQNCAYDWFAQRLGLPPIYIVDPDHPRVRYAGTTGWPWNHATF